MPFTFSTYSIAACRHTSTGWKGMYPKSYQERVASYLGMLKHGNAKGLRDTILRML